MGICCRASAAAGAPETVRAPEPPAAASPPAAARPDLARPSFRDLVRGPPAHIIRPIPEAEHPTEEEMLAALMASPMSRRQAQRQDQREAYVDWLKRGHAGSTPAPFCPRPTRAPIGRMASFSGSSASDATDVSVEDRILSALERARPPRAGA